MQKIHVVVIGGGYGGIRAIERLSKDSHIKITLIDQKPYHYLQTEVYDFIANKVDMSEVMIDLPSLMKSFSLVDFICDEVISVDYDAQTVRTSSSQTLSYDFLIFATGSRTYFPDFIRGLRDNAHGVKSIPTALDFKQQFERALFNRIDSQHNNCATQPFNIVIGGAGLSGVEIAAEMAAYANRFYNNGNFGCRGIDVYLIDAYKTILFGMDPFLIDSAHERLLKLGVHVWHNNRISEVREKEIVLDNGEILDFEFMIFTGGVCAASLSQELGLAMTPKGHLDVNEDLSIANHPNVFAIGDIANILNEEGKPLPPTAQLAERSAQHVARTIIRKLQGKVSQPFTFKSQGIMIALGGEYGAGILPGGIKVKGYLAYLVKKAISLYYTAPLRRRSAIGKHR